MQSPSVQFCDWSTRPSQSLPPFLGAGLLHSLLLHWVHSVPQADHLLQSVHTPSTRDAWHGTRRHTHTHTHTHGHTSSSTQTHTNTHIIHEHTHARTHVEKLICRCKMEFPKDNFNKCMSTVASLLHRLVIGKVAVRVCVDDGWFEQPHLAVSDWTRPGEAAETSHSHTLPQLSLPLLTELSFTVGLERILTMGRRCYGFSNVHVGNLADALIQSDIHRLIHKLTHRRQSQPCKVTGSSSGAVRIRCHAQGHINTELGGAGDRTSNLSATRQLLYLLSQAEPSDRSSSVSEINCPPYLHGSVFSRDPFQVMHACIYKSSPLPTSDMIG